MTELQVRHRYNTGSILSKKNYVISIKIIIIIVTCLETYVCELKKDVSVSDGCKVFHNTCMLYKSNGRAPLSLAK